MARRRRFDDLGSVFREVGVNLAFGAVRRQIEEVFEPILEKSLRRRMVASETLRELVSVIREIPFVRSAGVGAINALGKLFAQRADDLWPGDNRPYIAAMRRLLKQLGPMLNFAADISADALERALKEKADEVIAIASQLNAVTTPSPFEAWGARTWDVFRAYNKALTRLVRAEGYDWVKLDESEGLVKSLAEGKVDPTVVEQLIGNAFHNRIGQGTQEGEFTIEVVDELEQVVFDLWMQGEQPLHTKIIRHARRVWRSGRLRRIPWWKVVGSVFAVTVAVSLPVLVVVGLFAIAAIMFLVGIYLPSEHKNVALQLVLWSGWLAFVATWTFPMFQTATAWAKGFLGLKDDWLVSVGRRIVAFVLLVCSGMEFYAVALNLGTMWRTVIIASAGVGIALSMGLTEAGYRQAAERAFKRAALPLGILFGGVPLALAFTWGVWQANKEQVKEMTQTTESWISTLTWQHGLVALIVTLVLFRIVTAFRRPRQEAVASSASRGERMEIMLTILWTVILLLPLVVVALGLWEFISWLRG